MGGQGARGSLGKKTRLFAEIYNFEDVGNYLDESTHKRTGGIPTFSSSRNRRRPQARPRATEARSNPCGQLFASGWKESIQKDDKVLTDWNGLMIPPSPGPDEPSGSGPTWIRRRAVADFASGVRDGEGRLLKRWREGGLACPPRRLCILRSGTARSLRGDFRLLH